jgi:hypothetical protein
MQKYLAKMDALNTPLEKFGDELYYALKADDEMQRTKKKGGG